MSQILIIPSESLIIVMPSFACRVLDWIGAEVIGGVDFELVTAGSINEALICQNLTDPSQDAEMRENGEENVREIILLVWPMKVPMW